MSAPGARILVVDDDAAVCWALEQALRQAGHRVDIAADARAARRLLARGLPDLVITDVRMPGESGLDLLAWLRSEHPGLPVIVSTAHGTVDVAVAALGRGAFDYLPKPLDLDRTLAAVARATGDRALAAAAQPAPAEEGDLVGGSPAMQEVFRRLAAAAASDFTVLVGGESGTGKELVARAIHRHSRRRDGPFVAIGCGALPDGLADAELFGTAGGRPGLIAGADGGTLLLDEVGDLPSAAQACLLRFLEDGLCQPAGGGPPRPLSVRVIASTARDLDRLAVAGVMRPELVHRLRVVTIHLPALAQRGEDLPALVRHLLARTARHLGRPLAATEAALARLRAHPWPGNVRELRHVLEEAAAMAGNGGVIDAEHLRLPSPSGAVAPPAASLAALAEALLEASPGQAHALMVGQCETALIRAALARTAGNQLRSAELLGINRTTLKKRMDELGIPSRQ